jgi:hypothetical protein
MRITPPSSVMIMPQHLHCTGGALGVCGASVAAKHLMHFADDEQQIGLRPPFEKGCEFQIETAASQFLSAAHFE